MGVKGLTTEEVGEITMHCYHNYQPDIKYTKFSCNWAKSNTNIAQHTITGRIWVICPVSSNTITDVDIVWVTAADIAAAPVSPSQKKFVLPDKRLPQHNVDSHQRKL